MKTFDKDKMAKPQGRMPAMQYLPPSELEVDPSYQRSIEGNDSQKLIRAIAAAWRWDLCQTLVVSQRGDKLFVIDGQHRLEAAKLRGDIGQLPCIVGEYDTMQQEAEAFTKLNTKRRALSSIEKFNAAVASGDETAVAIRDAIENAGLSLAKHSNWRFWEPGMISNVGGIQKAWMRHGAKVATMALDILAEAFAGEVLQYGGTLYGGIVPLCVTAKGNVQSADRKAKLLSILGRQTQAEWRSAALRRQANDPGLGVHGSLHQVLLDALSNGSLAPKLPPRKTPIGLGKVPTHVAGGDLSNFDQVQMGVKKHCDQCDSLKSPEQVRACASKWCSLRDVA